MIALRDGAFRIWLDESLQWKGDDEASKRLAASFNGFVDSFFPHGVPASIPHPELAIAEVFKEKLLPDAIIEGEPEDYGFEEGRIY